MRPVTKYLEQIRKIERRKHHPLIHKVHKQYHISRKTLFYIKEYGEHSNVIKTILKESIKILLFASIISSVGGFALEYIKTIFLSFIPLIILMPVLNDLIGNYGTIISARFSTLLHENKVRKVWHNNEITKLFLQILLIASSTAVISTIIAFFISSLSGYKPTSIIITKILLISLINVVLLVTVIFIVAIIAGLHFYKKKEDPNNFLIPITTSVADFGNMIILSLLVVLFF